MRADLRRFYGLNLNDVGYEFTLLDLADYVACLPRDSATMLAAFPSWSVSEHLLANIDYSLRWLVWAKTSDGAKNRNRPKPIPRPGDTSGGSSGRLKDATVLPLDEVKRRLRLPRR